MTDPMFKMTITKIQDGDKVTMQVRVNDSAPGVPVETAYTIADLIIIIQALGSIGHYFTSNLSNILMDTVEVDKTAYPLKGPK